MRIKDKIFCVHRHLPLKILHAHPLWYHDVLNKNHIFHSLIVCSILQLFASLKPIAHLFGVFINLKPKQYHNKKCHKNKLYFLTSNSMFLIASHDTYWKRGYPNLFLSCCHFGSICLVTLIYFHSYLTPGVDVRSEPCQRFFRDGLTTSFTKILTDEAVSGWKFEIHVSGLESTGTQMHTCVRCQI